MATEKTITELIQLVDQFRDERNWRQFHNEKDLALSVVLESAELLERFQWKTPEQAVQEDLVGIKEEIADVLIYLLMLTSNLDFSVTEMIEEKLQKNAIKYPKNLS